LTASTSRRLDAFAKRRQCPIREVEAGRARYEASMRLGTCCGLLVLLAAAWCTVPARAAGWGSAAIVQRAGGEPTFEVDGKPFFVYGAAFFYERLPRDTWATSMRLLRDQLHVNVLDLYVPWNWHELADGDFDFQGRTNPRRDLREVLRLSHELGFKLVLRPGPVVRNEWRNGGYPAWLLARPEYGMPPRDIREGRYPATATLQNAHSDDAAAAWMRNATHVLYARRWLDRVFLEFAPVSRDVLAVALDDDQGAYIDNQTWPAPHLRAYLGWLRSVVRRDTSARLPVFINTYEMKVTASSPVWAMGNWYQSDAFQIGEHDRSQLEFSTGLLHTRPHQPMMLSEFQAGWLQQPGDVLPQPADPSNTLLALHTLLASGVRGIINFPAQDTYAPAGWEAPFSNAFYAWDAALGYDAASSGRAAPTAYVGRLIATFGPALASAHVVADAAIAYATSAYDAARLTNADVASIADATIAAQRGCRDAGLSCPLVDLRYAGVRGLARYPLLVIPEAPARAGAFTPTVAAALRWYRRAGGVVLRDSNPAALVQALRRQGRQPVVTDAGAATYAQDPATGAGFLTLENYGAAAASYPHPALRRLDGSLVRLPPLTLGPRDALLLPVDVPLRTYARAFAPGDVLESSSCPVVAFGEAASGGLAVARLPSGRPCTTRFRLRGVSGGRLSVVSSQPRFAIRPDGGVASVASGAAAAPAPAALGTLPIRNDLRVPEPPRAPVSGGATAYFEDVYRDGMPCVVLENELVRLVLSPAAGGRAFVFEDKTRGWNAFDTIGALRDDVAVAPPPSATDRIAKYTHQFPAGFFNRPYAVTILTSGPRAAVRLHYDAPDAWPNGGSFERVVTLEPNARRFDVVATATFDGDDPVARAQRGVLVSSFVAGDPHAASGVRVLPSGDVLADAPPVESRVLGEAGENNVAGLFDEASHDLVLQAWSENGEAARGATTRPYARHLTTSVVLGASGGSHLAFDVETAATLDEARERLRHFGCDVARQSGARAETLQACAVWDAAESRH
jgi:hypothetical protein